MYRTFAVAIALAVVEAVSLDTKPMKLPVLPLRDCLDTGKSHHSSN